MKKSICVFIVFLMLSIILPIQTFTATADNGPKVKNTILKVRQAKKSSPKFRGDKIIVKYKNDKKRFHTVSLPKGKTVAEAIGEYSALGNVEYAEPDYIAYADMVPNDPYYNPYQWHLDNSTGSGINAEEAWDVTTGSSDVVVAVIDTGIAYETARRKRIRYYQAPELSGTCFVTGYDFANNDSYPNDDEGHGTHVTGTIAQNTNNSTGVAGVAFDTCIMPVKVLGKDGSGYYSDIAEGIYFAVDNGADVINMSLGGSSGSSVLEDAVSYAYENGVTVLAAAGNDGNDLPHYPSSYNDYVISVGATDYVKGLAWYSNYGNDVDIVAPGGDTSNDANGDGYVDGVLQQTFSAPDLRKFGYYFYQGTSMATPHVAGVAALLLANGNATTPDEIRSALEETARDIGDPYSFGNGLIDAAAALNWTSGPINNTPTVALDPLPSVVTGVVTVSATASDSDGTVTFVEFTAGSTTHTDTTAPYSFDWDTMLEADGDYIVTATATDDLGATESDSIAVTVDNVNDPPVADAGEDQTVIVNTLVSLDGTDSSDTDGTISTYDWDFGDINIGTGATPNHTYTTTGTYTVTLTVTDDDGATDTDTLTVTVEEEPTDIEVFYDSFEVSEWNGLWTEDSQNDWRRYTQRATNGSYCAEVDGSASDASLTSINIDLQGKSNATITFDWLIERGLDRGEYLAFDISIDGGTWINYAQLNGNADAENTWHAESIDVTGANTIQLRFRGKMNRSNEDADVDNVRVMAY